MIKTALDMTGQETLPQSPAEGESINKLEDTNILDSQPENKNPLAGSGEGGTDVKVYKTGKKAGQPRPSQDVTKKFDGLRLDELKSTPTKAPEQSALVTEERKAKKAERKLIEAKTGAKLVMRMLDTLNNWISGGTFGQDFNDQQRNDRNKYRQELEQDWQDYLLTLDIPLHPGLVVAFGSMMYVAPAMETAKGQERVQSFKEKIIGKTVSMFLRKK